MDLIKELGPSGSDNDDDEPEEGLIIIPPQCHTPDSSSVGQIILPRGLSSSSDIKGPVKETLFRQSVKNKLKAFTEGRVSLPGSPILGKSGNNKKERKLTIDNEPIDKNVTSVVRDVKLQDNSPTVKGDLPIPSAVVTEVLDAVGQNELSSKSSVVDDRIKDIQPTQPEEANCSKSSVSRTTNIDRKESKVKKIKTYPKSWIEIKEKEIDLDTLRSSKDYVMNTDHKTSVDFRQQLLFKSPANQLNGFNCRSADNKPNQRVAPQYLRYTNSLPQVAWSCNPLASATLTRSEIFEYIPTVQKDSIEKLMGVINTMKPADKMPLNKWYNKMPLVLCEAENSNFEPLRLSFFNNSSDIEVREDVISYELTPKAQDNQSNIVEENILLKVERKHKKKRSRSITDDEQHSKKKRSKKHRKEKKKNKSKNSNILEISNSKKEISAENLHDCSEISVYSKSKKVSKSSVFLEHNEKLSRHSKDHCTSTERKNRVPKYFAHSSTKSRSKSHEDIPRKDFIKIKPAHVEPEESHTPKTEEYHSRWESDEELLKLEHHVKKKYKHRSSSKNMCWESDDDRHSTQKYSSRSVVERSLEMPLEMPLNIVHVSRHRTTPKYSDGGHKQRNEQPFYFEDSWERGEYLKIKNELDNIDLQKERQTLIEERRLLEIEKQKVAEMELRIAEEKYKQQQQLQQKHEIVLNEEDNVKSTEKRYFENIGKVATQDESFVCEYHKAIIDSKRKSRWETPKDDTDSTSIQTEEHFSPPLPRPVSTSPFPFHKSPIGIDVNNYSPKDNPPAVDAQPISIETREKESTTELIEDIQLPSSSGAPVLIQNIEKVVELENEYEQFMMSLTNANEIEDAHEPDIVVAVSEDAKMDTTIENVLKVQSKKSTSSSSSESSSGSSDSSDTSSSNSLEIKPKKDLATTNQIELKMQESVYGNSEITVPSIHPLIINQPLSGYKTLGGKPRVPITILETIIIEDDEVSPVKPTVPPEIDLSIIELPPQFIAPMDVALNLIELPPTSLMLSMAETKPIPEVNPEVTPSVLQETPPIPIPEELSPPPPPSPSSPPPPPTEETPLAFNVQDSLHISSVAATPTEDANVKRNNLISIKFLSPKKRALEMNSGIANEASDGEDDKPEQQDSTANTKRLLSSFNEPPSPARTLRPIDTRPQLITVEQKAKLDALRKETLERNEKWCMEKSRAAKEKSLKETKDLKDSKDIKDSKESSDNHKDKHSSGDRQRKDSSSDRKKTTDSNKRRPSKERESGRKRSVSPISKRRRVSPSRSDRDRDRDRDRLRRSSPRRTDKERDRREGKFRRSRSRSPPKSKSGDRRRSRDKSPKRRSGDRERDRREGRRANSPRGRKRSPTPSSKRRSHRERSRSTDRKKERIEDTLKRLAGIDQHYTSTSTYHSSTILNPSNRSPRSSPLDGFKRSLADSTISDDQLLPSITESPNPVKHSPKSDYYKASSYGSKTTSTPSSNSDYYHTHSKQDSKPKLSPKRQSLDDRINQVLGIEKTELEEAPRRISTTYEGQYDYKYAYPHPEYRGYNSGDMKADDGSRLVQIGNVLQIVPAGNGGESTRSRKEHSSHHHHQSHSSSSSSHHHHHQPPQQQILQVGNMLQIVPTALPTAATKPSIAAVVSAVTTVAPPPPPPPPLPLPVEEKAVVAEKMLSSADELIKQQHAQRKAEKEVRRQERDRRRKEKERKQKEREKKKALRVKTKTEDMIKRALMLETEQNREENATETAAVVEKTDEEVKWSPSNPILAGALANLTKPVGKSILTSEKLSKLNVTKALELLTESRKQVKFADGIIPGEGTSPSAGEELSSPPPSNKRALKEKRHSKSLLSKAVRNKLSKKKVKVTVVHSKKRSSRNNNNTSSNPPNPNNPPQQSSSDAELELFPPPSPPPGSPPPHIFPARVKPPPLPNNIHPAPTASFLHHPAAIAPAHYPYAIPAVSASPAGIMYATAGGVGVVGGYAAPPPPPPPPPMPSVASGANGRYGASIPTLPPTHQLPHHLALRAGASHKSRQ